MRRHLIGHSYCCFRDIVVFLLIQLFHLPGRSLAVVLQSGNDRRLPPGPSQQVHHFPWVDLDGDYDSSEIVSPLSRDRRSTNSTTGSKNVWQKIEEFYADKNNMAMYCVLPILILIYGGCSSIYCIHKCRQYLKGRKHKRLKEEDCDSLDTNKRQAQRGNIVNGVLKDDKHRPVSQISGAWTDLDVNTSVSRWSARTEAQPLGIPRLSPLPWQVPCSEDAMAGPKHTGRLDNKSGSGQMDNIMQIDDVTDKDNKIHTTVNEQHQNSRNFTDAEVLAIRTKTPLHHTSRPNVPAGITETPPFMETRTHCNLADYSTNKSTSLKAADYSRFSDSRSIEIIPLSAVPSLRLSEEGQVKPHGRIEIPRLVGVSRSNTHRVPEMSVLALKEDMLARYDAMSTLQMAKKAAGILNPDPLYRNPRKPASKRHIFITD